MKPFLLFISLFFCYITNATTFYISPTGNDATGNGTIGNPWKTLFKATSTVTTPGDIIHVNAGTYTETQTCNLAVGISIEGDGVTSVIRSTVSADWEPLLRAASNTEGTNGNQHISNVKFDGQNLLTFWGIEIVGRKNFSIYNCTIVDFDDRGVIFAGRVDNANAAPTVYATGNSFHDNVMTNCARYTPGYGAGCLNIGGQNGMLVYNNIISQDSRTPGNNGWPIKYWNDGYLDGCKIYNNTLNKIMCHTFLGNGCWDFAIELFNVRGLEIYSNTMNGGGIDLNYQDKGTYPFSVWIHHNLIQMPSINNFLQTAVTLEYQSETVLIEDNVFDKVNIGVNYTPRPGDAVTDNTIRRNLMTNIGKAEGTGFFITFGGSGGGSLTFNNLNVYNNTMVMSSTNPTWWGIDLPNAGSGTISNINIKNNIINGALSGGITQYSNIGTNTLSITNNDMYGNGNSNAPVFTNVPAPLNYTYTNNLIGVNPLFVGGGNYTLQSTSTLINAGVNVGLPFNGSAPDIGYAEYGGAASGPTPPIVGTITQPTCAVATGSVVLNGLPATGTWTLTRSPGGTTTTGTGTTTTITGLAPGTYTYTVTDATGTSTPSANIVINAQPTTPSAPTVGTITQPTCAVATGTVVLSGLPAAGTWTITRTPGGTTTTGTGATTTITGLAAGTYTFTVTNAGGCISSASANVVVNAQPGAPSAPLVGTITQPTCTVATGTVVLNGLPAAGTWTITRTPGGTTTTGTGTTTTITGLAAGTYTFTVTNASGCISVASANVVVNAQPATPSAPAVGTITQPTCTVATGTVVLSGLPATGTWTITRTPGGTTTTGTGTTTTIPGLAAGTYTFTVSNASGCISVASANVVINAQPATPSAPVVGTITQPTCAVATGSVVLSGLPATGTWILTRNPGGITYTGTGITTTIIGLAPSTYNFTVTNGSGCISVVSANVVINAQASTPSAPIVGTITQPTGTVTTGSVVLSGLPAIGTWTLTMSPGGTTTTGTGTTTTITGLAAGTYTFTVTNASGCISVASANVVINAAVNIPPVANAGPDQTITLPINSIIVSGSGTDPDGIIVAYLWTKVSGPAAGTITNPTIAASSVTGLVQGTYRFELRVTDNNGAFGRDTMQVTVNPSASNIPPVANAGPDQTITLPSNSIIVSGSGTDPDGIIVAYLWTKVSGPAAGTITNATTAATSVTGLVQGTYQFELRVTDNSGAFGRDTMQVTVNPGASNIPPVANAGPDQTITLPTNFVILSGSGTDADGTIAAYLWTKISGPAAGTITNATTAATSVTGLVQGTYRFELRVTDNNGAFGRDTMQVTVNPGASNIPPVANAGPDQTIILPTNSTILSGSGTDADGTVVAYLWTKISGPAAGTITNTTTAATSVTGLVQGTYRFELRVTDNSGAFGRDTMQVTVNPGASNIPPVANAGPDQTITLPTNSTILSGSGTDPDGTVVAYLWTKVSGPAAGTITNPTTVATSVTGLVQGTYRFELRVTDNSSAFGRDTMQIIVNPGPPNIPPTANAGPDQTITLPANSVILSGSGTDPDGTIVAYLWTKVSGPAAGTITNPNSATSGITGLVQGTYRFELRVTDNSGAFGRDTMQVTVNPGATNIPPTANAGPDQIITLPVNAIILSGSGTDPDGTVVAYQWTKISGPAVGTITNPNVAATSVTGLVQGTYRFELRVTDNSGAFGRDTMQVIVNPIASNIPPVADAGPDQTITLPNSSVILSGSGTDADGTVVAYLWTKVSGPAAGTITNPNMAATSVTGLAQGVYLFELRVTDNNGAFGRDTMQVIVNPIGTNIPPVADAGPDQSITLPVNSIILSGSGTDPDGNIVAYQWTKVSGPAAGTITNPNMAATSVTGLAQGVYLFELMVTDNDGAFGRDTMQVTVNPVGTNIPPAADAGPDQTITLPVNSIILSGSGTDTDGIIVAYQWTKVSGPAAGTITNPNMAATSVTGLVQGVYQFELRVTDDGGAFGRDTMEVTVNAAPNIPPTANAGPDQSIVAPVTSPANPANVTGSGTDPDGTIVAYLWTKISGPAAGSIANPNSAASSITGLAIGSYQFELRVTDNDGAFGRDTMQITISAPPNILPVANAGPDRAVLLPANSATLSGSGTDADGTITAYDWKQISGPSNNVLFSLHTATTYVNNLVEGTYEFELTVTDNRGGTAKDNVLVIVSATQVNIVHVNDASLYPNPVVGIATLDIKSEKLNSILSVIVTDMLGKIVYRKDLTATQFSFTEKIDMSNLLKGTYVVNVYFANGEKQTIKAIKQ